MSDVPSDHPLQAWLAATRGGSAGAAGPASAPDQHPPAPPGGLSKRLLAGTAGVCVAAVILGVTTTGLVPGRSPGEEVAGPAAPASLPTGTQPVASEPGSAPAPVVSPGAATSDPATTAAAVIAVRAAGTHDLYVDTAVVDDVTSMDGVTLVGIRAVVVPRVAGEWGAPATVRYAVPVGMVGGAATALADPWRLPAPTASAGEQDSEAVRDGGLERAAADSLAAAGYTRLADLRLSRPSAVPGLLTAEFRAVAPGDTAPRPAGVWLTGDALQVLGAPAPLPTPLDLPVP